MNDRFRSLESDHYDAIVVGAGTGGLTAAALLANRGKRVLVIDQHYVAGGNATVFRRKGYEFDVGLHYIGTCHEDGWIPRILRAADAGDVAFEELDPDGYDTLVFPDLTFRLPRGIEVLRQRLLEQFPAERRGIDRWIKLLTQLDRLIRLVGRQHAALWEVPRSLLALRWLGGTLGEFLDTCTSDPRLRSVLCGQHGDYAQPPSKASLVVAAGLMLHYLEGAYFPRGGGQVISDRLADSIERHGGKILLRASARRILVERGRAVGVELENPHLGVRQVRAPVVISNADLKRTLLDLVGPEHLPSSLLTRTRQLKMSPALGAVYLGIQRDLVAERFPRTNYWLFPHHDHERAYDEVAAGRIPGDPFAFLSLSSVKDPTNRRMAPAGVSNLQVMGLAPSTPEAWGVTAEQVRSGAYSESETYQRRKTEYASALIASASKILPDLERSIVFQEVATPLTHGRYTRATEGTSYGIALVPSQLLSKRPAPTTPVKGLYLCGASCRSGHGIMGAMMSGVHAAEAALGARLSREIFVAARGASPLPALDPA